MRPNCIGVWRQPGNHTCVEQPTSLTAIADDLLTPAQAAALMAVKVTALAVWRHRKVGPPFVQLSPRTPRYSRRSVMEWIASRAIGTAQP